MYGIVVVKSLKSGQDPGLIIPISHDVKRSDRQPNLKLVTTKHAKSDVSLISGWECTWPRVTIMRQ